MYPQSDIDGRASGDVYPAKGGNGSPTGSGEEEERLGRALDHPTDRLDHRIA